MKKKVEIKKVSGIVAFKKVIVNKETGRKGTSLRVNAEDSNSYNVLAYNALVQLHIKGIKWIDGKQVATTDAPIPGDYVTVTGKYDREKWAKGGKSGINHTIWLNRKCDISWIEGIGTEEPDMILTR